MRCSEIIKILESQSPEHLACDWDNVGLLVGSREKEVERVYVALDATDDAIAEAATRKADMLLTHHPMIFKGLKKVTDQDFIERRVIALIRHDIACYAMHTNFDIAGMAELAAERMGLTDTCVLQKTGETEEGPVGIGRVGSLPRSLTLAECAARVKEAFAVDTVKVFGFAEQISSGEMGKEPGFAEQTFPQKEPITRVALCPGSGKSVIGDALRAGAQVLITGDIDHHEGIDAAAQGMAIIDAGHYGMEKLFIPYMKQYLDKRAPELSVITEPPRQPFVYL